MMRQVVLLTGMWAVTTAQGYVLKTTTVDCGGARLASSSYACGMSFGQQVASGVLVGDQYQAVLGFWHEPYGPPYGLAEEVGQMAPLTFRLNQNVPNPFGRLTAICYTLPRESDVALKVYNSVGRVVTTLVQGRQKSGRYTVSWNVSSVPAAKLPCGTYFCRLEAGEFTATRKMVKTD